MTSDKTGVPLAELDWSSGEAVRSTRFGDVYYSDLGGLEETRHVFIDGNDLPARFAALAGERPSHLFTIGELGFGTGLNILAVWDTWEARGHDRGRLHIFSVEGFPLSAADFARAQDQIAERWPKLADKARQLARLYPVLAPGLHQLPLATDVTLTLAIGEVGEILNEADLSANAWFLDGFSPARNEAMWRDEVIDAIGRLSAAGATAATFTVAGAVRRRLQAAGFEIEKRPGFGRKREMLGARLVTPAEVPPSPAPWFDTTTFERPAPDRPITIAGAGIAGASLAWHLRRAGIDCAVYDPSGPAAGASGNPAGLIMPRLDAGDTPARAFYLHAWAYTVRLIEMLERETGAEIFASRGGIMLATDAETSARHEKIAAGGLLPVSALRLITKEEAEEISGVALSVPADAQHLYLPQAGTIRPAAFVSALLGDTPVISENAPAHAGFLIHATGPAIIKAQAETIMAQNLSASRGQIDCIRTGAVPASALTFGHYIAPLDGAAVTGATYEQVDPDAPGDITGENSTRNIEEAAAMVSACQKAETISARAALRCTTRDRHPVIGPLPDEPFFLQAYAGLRQGARDDYPPARWQPGQAMLAGLGSRGLVTGPYGASILTAMLTGAPVPAPRAVSDLVSPARFIVRGLKRSEL